MSDLAAKHRLAVHGINADVLRAWAAMGTGEPTAEAIDAFERGVHKLITCGSHSWIPFFLAPLATALAATGRHDEAVHAIERAFTSARRSL